MRNFLNLQPSTFNLQPAFSLLEVLVVVSLLSLIVIALMAVFSSTQRAFRASVTQTDVLESGRAAVDLITTDLRAMSPSGGVSNGPVNFFAADNGYFSWPALAYSPLSQNLPGATVPRVNQLNYFFILSRENTKWVGIGYAVDATNTLDLYPLYRFYAETNLASSPTLLANNFFSIVDNGEWFKLSRLVNGVVHFSVKAYDPRGYEMTNTYQFQGGGWATNRNVQFYPSPLGSVGFAFYSNMVPASVELEVGVLEDRALARAESRGTLAAQWNYLTNQSGALHLFRQRVSIPNVDASAYQ